jgi:hypothetical protein
VIRDPKSVDRRVIDNRCEVREPLRERVTPRVIGEVKADLH